MIRKPGILVTRPEDQIEEISRLIARAGGRPVPFPLLRIAPRQPPILPADGMAGYQLVVFVSVNAVRYGMPYLADAKGSLPSAPLCLALGRSTAARLADQGLEALYPQQADSEGLLQMAETQQVSGKRVLIVRGVGGREALAATLVERGAAVDYLEVYSREPYPWTHEQLLELLQTADIRLVVLSSAESLTHFHQLLAGAKQGRELDLMLSSARLAGLATELGYTRTRIAGGADNARIVEAVTAWVRQQ